MSIQHNVSAVVSRLGGIPKNALESVDAELSVGSQKIARSGKLKVAKASSELANAINARRIAPMIHEVVASKNYAKAVESGTGPGGFASKASIEDWMQSKNIVGSAFAIARSIAEKGTKAQPYMKPALEDNRKALNARIRAAVSRAL